MVTVNFASKNQIKVSFWAGSTLDYQFTHDDASQIYACMECHARHSDN